MSWERAGSKSARPRAGYARGSREGTWLFSLLFRLVNKVKQTVQKSRQLGFGTKIYIYPLFAKGSFEKHTRTLIFSKRAVTGRQADSGGNAKAWEVHKHL
jgi:hypothetical protein